MLICPNCFHQNPNGLPVCEACCYELTTAISCSTCGASCFPDAKFCGSCGASLQPKPLVSAAVSMGNLDAFPKTQIQDSEPHDTGSVAPISASLLHLQSEFRISLNMGQPVIHLGKPNLKVSPDINLAAFSHAEVVSRIHADICIEDNLFYIEDKGSCNGTFLNNQRIRPGEKKPLISGDKITLGKGNLVSFIFELS